MAEPRNPFRSSPRRALIADLAVAGFVAVVGVLEMVVAVSSGTAPPLGQTVTVAALNLVIPAALVWRRRWPFRVFVVVIVAGTAVVLTPGISSAVPAVAGYVALYTVATWRPDRRVAWAALGIAVAAIAVQALPEVANSWGSAVVQATLALAVWLVGRSRRLRRAYVESLEQRARYLEQAREAATRAAIAEERTRIARELHDVVAHHVSVMTVQAAGGTRVARREKSGTLDTLTAIEHTGREALGELRRLLGVLRAGDDRTADPDEREPHKGLADLKDLVSRARDAGLDAELRLEGADAAPVDAGVGLTAYRIVQEALTNVVNHAGPTRVRVLVRRQPDAVDIQVLDDGGSAPRAGAGSGHGLVGMRERVAMLGGELTTGPRSGGGFQVRARLPVREAR